MINEIVKQMLEEHKGGCKFFDAIDESFRNKDILDIFWQHVWDYILFNKDNSEVYYNGIILSGNFGRAILNYTSIHYDCVEYAGIQCIAVNGSLRGDNKVENFVITDICDENYKPKFLFLDDSFYSGKTRDKIKAKLESYGAELVHTHVLYDGCYETHDDVSSMYRYYDNH